MKWEMVGAIAVIQIRDDGTGTQELKWNRNSQTNNIFRKHNQHDLIGKRSIKEREVLRMTVRFSFTNGVDERTFVEMRKLEEEEPDLAMRKG